ncbi:TPR Domain containing protein [Tritrichomonas foetus]|uniref:Outer dynein arm-docking complex subunit 4 n=1 Tax=Tritrichomonas foetus TaxID=1144522 RepID=A0A1J4L5U8_9EUKA|nr:TPR Domain containing protein [Tritrichomonas foetus]|eukprot:OHT17326.1 TPR Domain containing protein [Tritrichomonas foetus]
MEGVRTNAAYNRRLAQTAKLLGKDQEITKIDEETGETVIVKKSIKGKPISKEMAADLEYRALVSEGNTLYQAKEYRRAIDAYTQAMEKQKDDPSILIERANCYIKVGQPEDGLKDIDNVLNNSPNNPKAILTKAEAYFSMGEFEFSLVFFQRGKYIRKDMVAFRDGITKCKSAILDSINGENLFQANPNFAVSRPRKALVTVSKERSVEPQVDEAKLAQTAALLPEKVEPLSSTEEKAQYLGELQLDYDYLLELQEEVTNVTHEDEYSKKEDEKIASVVADALLYLDQRGAFWCQQGGSTATKTTNNDENGEKPETSKTTKNTQERTTAKSAKSIKTKNNRTAHYEMSKIQQYETKYGSPDRKTRSPKTYSPKKENAD